MIDNVGSLLKAATLALQMGIYQGNQGAANEF